MSWRSNDNIKILGSAVSIGQPRQGVEKTPSVLQAEKIEDLISIGRVTWVETIDQPAYTYENPRLNPIRNVQDLAKYNKILYEKILSHLGTEDFLLTIGGDHSIGSATVGAMLKATNGNLGVIWIDAHGDCNTPETSPSGNYHGMPVAHLLGLFQGPVEFQWDQPKLSPTSIAMIGIRDLDPEEKILMDRIGIKYYTMDMIHEIGIETTITEALAYIDPDGTKKIHMSFDVDGIDPQLVPGTGTRAPNGLTLHDYAVIAQKVKLTGDRFASMDLVEINFDIERNVTLDSVKEIIRITFQ
ncbi:hypothetical protein SteCoe_7391 [Stentor coeruleus]|uniref:Arginase n=1 Tax=Stentor coeruleus TaxID=5963 RepID=A0A1R2CMP5_9CILI|nr:hypothetical protein SteCoe_7391 [Stentor coeruleus]